MKSLLFTLFAFFALVFGTLALDRLYNGTVTGRGLTGSLAIALILTGLHCYRSRMAAAERKREERLVRRAGATRRVEAYLKRLHDERGASEPDLLNWLVAVAVIAILLFLVTGRCAAAGAIPMCGEPTGFQMLACGVVGLVAIRRRGGAR